MAIVVPNIIAEQQFEQYTNQYCDDKVTSITARQLHARDKTDVYICDEADKLFKEHAVHIEQGREQFSYSVFGLAAVVRSKKAFYMSATFDTYMQRIFRDLFDI